VTLSLGNHPGGGSKGWKMTLEELQAAWDAALTALKADQKNATLKKAADDAQAAFEAKKAEEEAAANEPDPESDDPDEEKLDAKTKAYLAKLRKENASHRTKNKDLVSKSKEKDEKIKAILKAAGIETDEDPAKKIEALTAQTQTAAFRNAVLESALEHGIGKDDLEFYEFLVAKAAGQLGEDEELSEDQVAEIVKQVKAKSAKGRANTTVGKGKDGKGDPDPDNQSGVTFVQFLRMGIAEKSALYTKHPDVYNKFVQQAKQERKLVQS
jgi:hypothetical protein